MKRQVLKEDIGKFGKIVGGKDWDHQHSIYGYVVDVDSRGAVYFKDNHGVGQLFMVSEIESFAEQEFKDKSK